MLHNAQQLAFYCLLQLHIHIHTRARGLWRACSCWHLQCHFATYLSMEHRRAGARVSHPRACLLFLFLLILSTHQAIPSRSCVVPASMYFYPHSAHASIKYWGPFIGSFACDCSISLGFFPCAPLGSTFQSSLLLQHCSTFSIV